MAGPPAFDNPVATVLVFGPLVGSVLLEHRRFRGDTRRRRSDKTYWLLQAWQLAGLLPGVLLAKWLPSAALPGPAWLWPIAGCAVGVAGVGLRWWAIRTLGRYFTRELQVDADHELVTEGPYRWVRHPSYTGAILAFAGVGIGVGNLISVVLCTVLPAVGYIQRIPREEALLHNRLGEPYAEYASRTDRLVPGLW